MMQNWNFTNSLHFFGIEMFGSMRHHAPVIWRFRWSLWLFFLFPRRIILLSQLFILPFVSMTWLHYLSIPFLLWLCWISGILSLISVLFVRSFYCSRERLEAILQTIYLLVHHFSKIERPKFLNVSSIHLFFQCERNYFRSNAGFSVVSWFACTLLTVLHETHCCHSDCSLKRTGQFSIVSLR